MNPVSSVKFTYQDYLLFPENGKRHELIDGEHYWIIDHGKAFNNIVK